MKVVTTQQWVGDALGQVDSAVLPSLSAMLDLLLDAASLARPGADADAYAADLRSLASELDGLTRQMGAAARAGDRSTAYRVEPAA